MGLFSNSKKMIFNVAAQDGRSTPVELDLKNVVKVQKLPNSSGDSLFDQSLIVVDEALASTPLTAPFVMEHQGMHVMMSVENPVELVQRIRAQKRDFPDLELGSLT